MTVNETYRIFGYFRHRFIFECHNTNEIRNVNACVFITLMYTVRGRRVRKLLYMKI